MQYFEDLEVGRKQAFGRYDVTRALGVNLEYTRFGRFATETFANPVPDSDQVRLGVQFRF